jgi:DNA-binding Lrp family transcriptional regulator
LPQEIGVLLNVFVESQELESVSNALEKIPEVVDLFEITGEYDLVAHIRTPSIAAFRELLKDHILKIKGVRSTVSAVVVHTHKQEGKVRPD